jgi:hypothetical protein
MRKALASDGQAAMSRLALFLPFAAENSAA